MKVLKFGGTSVGTVESLRNVKSIVESIDEPAIVVVSALGGLTDKLIATAKIAVAGGDDYLPDYQSMIVRHHDIINTIVPPERRADLLVIVDGLLEELGNIYKGVSLIRDLSPRTIDIIVSYGERLSSTIIARIISGARFFDSRYFIKTLDQFGKHVLDNEATQKLVEATFADADFSVAVVPGFISTDINGDITNLGRGGSDYTAAILAAALNARVLEIWTDVDGFMTADPRIIPSARVIDRLSFIEAMELCNFGAKVIYPPTIYPVFHKNIPIYIKNTFNPSAPGTCISDQRTSAPNSLKGISSVNDTCLITLSGRCMTPESGVNARIFNALARQGVSVFLVSQESEELTVAFAVRDADANRAVSALETEFMAELQTGEINPMKIAGDLATVAVVGENMRESSSAIASGIYSTLADNNIAVIAGDRGASDTNISFVIKLSDREKALNIVHDGFLLN